jgi:acetylornithine aminotransferase/acetylornithine/N-succinyldiaminopimelate aminotransferase
MRDGGGRSVSETLENTQRLEREFLLPTYERFAVQFERGEGVYLYDSEGKRYLDFLSGIGVNALGYGHPAVSSVVQQQASNLVHVSNLFYNPYQGKLAQKLCAISGLDKAFFSNSGTEAWEAAIKLTRLYAAKSLPNVQKTRLLAMKNSFHGRTIGSISTTGQDKYRKPFEPAMPDVTFVDFNNVADLERKFDSSVAAVMLETIQGEGGVQPVAQEFLTATRALTKDSGALLILDEIQCGLGRTSQWFAYQHYGITPDMVTIAKPIAGGLPLGAVICTNAVAESMKPGLHGTTFGGGPLACAAALAVLSAIEHEGLLEHVHSVGDYFVSKLRSVARNNNCIRDVRGMGLMVAAELDSSDVAKAAVVAMLEKGFVINRTNEKVLRFLPPFLITTDHVDQMVAALGEVLASCLSKQAESAHA